MKIFSLDSLKEYVIELESFVRNVSWSYNGRFVACWSPNPHLSGAIGSNKLVVLDIENTK